jgi:hypothetical protein
VDTEGSASLVRDFHKLLLPLRAEALLLLLLLLAVAPLLLWLLLLLLVAVDGSFVLVLIPSNLPTTGFTPSTSLWVLAAVFWNKNGTSVNY